MTSDPRDAVARMAAIVESSEDAIISKDLNGRVTSWNPAAERMFGYSAAEMIGQSITTIIPAERRSEEDEVLRRIRAGLRMEPFETVRCRKDGSTFDVALTISAIRSGDGRIIGASKIARDITERKAMERDVRRLAAIVESSDDAIVAKDLNGVIHSWNAGAERIFGYSAAEAIGRHITLIIPEDRYEEETLVLGRIRAGLPVHHFETVRRAKDGSMIDISLTVSPIRSARGEVIGASKIARDISEQKALRRAVEQASRAKDEFLATLSHELRTPLNTVLGYTQMLQRGMLRPEDLAGAIAAIGRNAEALTSLVNDVLDASRIATGKMRLNLQTCEIADVIAAAVDTVRPAAAAKSIQLEVQAAPGLQMVGDPNRMQQVIWNLLSNAVKFTPADGRVSARATSGPGYVRITIEDTGIGIAPELLPRVFDRFWQADSTHSRGHGGLGLGLALVRHFVELHGGEVSAHSGGLGKGTRFEVTVPVSAVAVSPGDVLR